MNVQSIADLARSLTGSDSAQVPDATFLSYANIVYDDLWTTIAKEVDEDYFFHTWYVNTLAGVNTYSLPSETGVNIGMIASLGASIRHTNTSDYVRLRQSRVSALDHDLAIYRYAQSQLDPFFVLGDTHILVFPEPSESVIQGLKLYGVRANSTLAMDTPETAIGIPRPFHHLLALGVRAYIQEARGNLEEATVARAHYHEEKSRMIRHLSERQLGSDETRMPDLFVLS